MTSTGNPTNKEARAIGNSPTADRKSLIAEARADEMAILYRRPERISVTLDRPWADVFAFRHNVMTDNIEIKTIDSSILQASAFLPLDKHSRTFVQEGDILESINDFSCRDTCLSDVMEYLDEWTGRVTIVVSTNSNSGLYQAVTMKPCEGVTEECSLGLTLGDDTEGLCIKKLSPGPTWIGATSVLNEGDLVVAINSSPCLALAAAEGQQFLDANALYVPCMSITTIPSTMSQKHWRKARKVAVAVSGGTMVGVGAVMMVTPLHPVGHAMAIGGGCLLGKEFEAPQRALHRLSSSVRRDEPKVIETEPC